MTIAVEKLPCTRLSMRHLSGSTQKAFRQPLHLWPAAGFSGFHGILVYAHDENLGTPAIPDDMWAILEQARRAGIEYVHFDEDMEPSPGLPVYGTDSDKPDGLDVYSIDIGDLFFAGGPSEASLVCMMGSFDDEAIYAHVYNLDVNAKFSRLSGRLIGFRAYGTGEADYRLPASSLVQNEWGQGRINVRLIGDPDFDFSDAEQSGAALAWAQRQIARLPPTELDETPTP